MNNICNNEEGRTAAVSILKYAAIKRLKPSEIQLLAHALKACSGEYVEFSINQTRLSQELQIQQSNLSRTLSGLVKKGVLERVEDRFKVACLSQFFDKSQLDWIG
jgi:DNA-binding MarR family transcriptional regulator